MASATEQSDFESPSKKRKLDSSDAEDSNNCSDTPFAQFSSSSESQIDACEDSGFTDSSNLDADSQTCHNPPSPSRPHKKTNTNCQIMEKLLALRELIGDHLWQELAYDIFAPPPRQKLSYVSRLMDVVKLIKTSRRIMILTGAGVSVSCGIPDFRSRNGVYARLAQDFPTLPDPHAMFDSQYFRQDPRPFFKFAKEIYPGSFEPSPSHKFIRSIELHGKLLRNYTQNIDTLERTAGIRRVIECHGSFAKATCTKCSRVVRAEMIRNYIFEQQIPVCEICNPGTTHVSATDPNTNFKDLVTNGILKPNIVFFGEDLPSKFYKCIRADRNACDLLLVIGSSLKVRPVAEVPTTLPAHVPQILINRERLPHCSFDVELLGDSDVIVNQLCHRLGESWQNVRWQEPLTRTKALCPENADIPPKPTTSPECLSKPSIPDNDFTNVKIDKNTITQLKQYLNPMTRLQSTVVSSSSVPSSAVTSEIQNQSFTIFEKFGTSNSNDSVPHTHDYVDFSDESSFLDFDQTVSFPESAQSDENLTNINATISNLDQSSDNAYHQFNDNYSFLKNTSHDSSSDVSDASSFFDNYTSGDLSSCNSTSTNGVVPQIDDRLLVVTNSTLSPDVDRLNKNLNLYKEDTFTDSSDLTTNPTDDSCDYQSDLEDSFSTMQASSQEDSDDSGIKVNVSSCLPPNSYYYRPPNQYIFPGAEVVIKKKYLNFMK